MPILNNVNGTLKTYTKIFTNVGGTLKEFDNVYENTGGILHTIYERPGAFTIITAGGGGPVSKPNITVTRRTAYAVIGYKETFEASFSAPGTGYMQTMTANATFYPAESCKVVVSGYGTISFQINDVEKGTGTFSVTPTDKCYFKISVSASFSSAGSGSLTIELKS